MKRWTSRSNQLSKFLAALEEIKAHESGDLEPEAGAAFPWCCEINYSKKEGPVLKDRLRRRSAREIWRQSRASGKKCFMLPETRKALRSLLREGRERRDVLRFLVFAGLGRLRSGQGNVRSNHFLAGARCYTFDTAPGELRCICDLRFRRQMPPLGWRWGYSTQLRDCVKAACSPVTKKLDWMS
jgi:hypothetical protein